MYSFLSNASTSNVTAYPSNRLNKATNFKTLGDTVDLPYNKTYNNCAGQFCYTYSKNYIYKQFLKVSHHRRWRWSPLGG